MKNVRYLVLISGLVVSVGWGCTAAKNTGEAIGEGTKEAAEQVAGATTDASITSAVKMKMADDPVVGAFDINVDTEDGNVTLTGTVSSEAEAEQAVQIARSVEGVRTVTTNLVVGAER